MRPDNLRTHHRFAALPCSAIALFSASPALASPISATVLIDFAPAALFLGAIVFGAISTILFRRLRKRSLAAYDHAQAMLAEMRAALDEYETLLAGLPEITIVWPQTGDAPRVMGQGPAILPAGYRAEDSLDFASWLGNTESRQMAMLTNALRRDGTGFEQDFETADGRRIRAIGRILSGTAVVRLRPQRSERASRDQDELGADNRHNIDSIIDSLHQPGFVRGPKGELVHVNASWWHLAEKLELMPPDGMLPELFAPGERLRQIEEKKGMSAPEGAVMLGEHRFDLRIAPLADGGIAGYLIEPRRPPAPPPPAPVLSRMGAIIDALETPVALFDGERQLRFVNQAYLDFWGVDSDTIKIGLDERLILDKLRGLGRLPDEVDYKKWRAEHLDGYRSSAPKETDWYLPDGRTVNVRATPLEDRQGMVYVLQDRTEQLAMESLFIGLGQVQTETLNALSEAVAVFGRNGKLTLSNPRLSEMWKIPINELNRNPHIDHITKSVAAAMPEDGKIIWQRLKQSIVDLNPGRADTKERIRRADGKVIEYAVVGLPDGQTMITFIDVTDTNNIQRLLKERNDALEEADHLKDAFVQNVSYELRSPLTNIIGFADMLASGKAGELNANQREYTDYIRTSSATLGALIDNILDLASVDAGIAEVHFEPVNIRDLVKKARAGLTATMSAGSAKPNLNLTVKIASNLPAIEADSKRLVQILYNLLSNAVRFSEPGASVLLDIRERAGRILITIEDEGSGVPAEVKAALLASVEGKPVRGRNTSAGLGLVIVKTFVNLHNGTISIEEREPSGTRVIVNLPAAQSSTADASA